MGTWSTSATWWTGSGAKDGTDILVYGGGGGVIVPAEIEELEAYGVRRIFSPSDGQRLGLASMINLLIEECDRDLTAAPALPLEALDTTDHSTLARWITRIESGVVDPTRPRPSGPGPGGSTAYRCWAVTGTGGSG